MAELPVSEHPTGAWLGWQGAGFGVILLPIDGLGQLIGQGLAVCGPGRMTPSRDAAARMTREPRRADSEVAGLD